MLGSHFRVLGRVTSVIMSGVTGQPPRMGMILECSPGEILARAAFMYHGNQWYNALKHYAVRKGLTL